MKTKLVISLAAAGALVLVVSILRLGSAPRSAEPSSSGAVGADSPGHEAGVPALDGERRSESRNPAGEGDPGARTPVPGADADGHPSPPHTSFRGRVLDAGGGPVAGVGIFVGSLGSDRARGIRLQSSSQFGSRGGATTEVQDAPRRIGESGVRGDFDVSGVPAGSILRAQGESYVPVLALASWGGAQVGAEPVLVVARPAAVAGIVVDETGRPIEDVEIAVRIPDSLKSSLGGILDRVEPLECYARSGPDGLFEIADAPGVAGRNLVATREGSPPQGQPIAAGPETHLRVVLGPAPKSEASVRGVVLDAQSRPVSDASVRLAGHDTRTGADGKFLLDATAAPPGSEILAAKPGFVPGRAVFDPQGSDVTLHLGPPTLHLGGRVVDGAGHPMRSVEVRALGLTRVDGIALEELATQDGPGPSTESETDGEGKFEVAGLQPRAYVLGLLDKGTLRAMRTEPIQAGRTDLEIRFQGVDATVRLAGRVVDRSGAPVAGAQVWLVRDIVREEGGPREGVLVFRTADGDGVFDFQDVARDVRATRVGFPGEMAIEDPIEAGQDLGHLVLVAYRRAHIQIDVSGSEVQADAFGVLDASGREMSIVKYEGNTGLAKLRWSVLDGRSEPLTVLDSAQTVVLFLGDAEVRRLRLEFVPGGLTVVRP